MSKLTKIQNELKVKKTQFNSYGKYHYRKCEDILEALKPLLAQEELSLVISDEVKQVGDFTFIEASVRLADGSELIASSAAQAGIEKAGGMALPQAFGAASSYARKYALGAMFLLDDTDDADATNTHGKESKTAQKASKPAMTKEKAIELLDGCSEIGKLKEIWTSLPKPLREDEEVIAHKDEAKRTIEDNT